MSSLPSERWHPGLVFLWGTCWDLPGSSCLTGSASRPVGARMYLGKSLGNTLQESGVMGVITPCHQAQESSHPLRGHSHRVSPGATQHLGQLQALGRAGLQVYVVFAVGVLHRAPLAQVPVGRRGSVWAGGAAGRAGSSPAVPEVPLEAPGEVHGDVGGAVLQLLLHLCTAGGADAPQRARAALDTGGHDVLYAVEGDELHGQLPPGDTELSPCPGGLCQAARRDILGWGEDLPALSQIPW